MSPETHSQIVSFIWSIASWKSNLEFKKADLDTRQELYRQIAEQIWNPEILMCEAEA